MRKYPSSWESGPSECTGAQANTGDNANGSDPQGNLTLQVDLSVSSGAVHEQSMDAFAVGLLIAVAAGTDAAAVAANSASSDNDLTLSDSITTGNAVAGNTATLFGDQANTNGGNAVTIGFGSGASVIDQSNNAYVTADGESAGANSGGNEQGSGGQFNGTGQVALAGALGTPAVALSLGVGIAAGGDASAAAANVSTHDDGEDGVSNFQDVSNTAVDGRRDCGQHGAGRSGGPPGVRVHPGYSGGPVRPDEHEHRQRLHARRRLVLLVRWLVHRPVQHHRSRSLVEPRRREHGRQLAVQRSSAQRQPSARWRGRRWRVGGVRGPVRCRTRVGWRWDRHRCEQQ